MLIDIHAHFGAGIPVARLATYAGVSDIDHVLVSNRDAASHPVGARDLDEAAANEATLKACDDHSRLLPVYRLRPGRIDSSHHAVSGALASAPFAALFLAPAENDFELSEELLGPYLNRLSVTRHPVLLSFTADARSDPGAIHALATRFPRVPFILCAGEASDSRRSELTDMLIRARKTTDADLYIDTSHADARAVDAAVRGLGPDRVLYGSDALSYGDSHVPRQITLLEKLRSLLTADAYRKVTAENAVRLFKLKPRS